MLRNVGLKLYTNVGILYIVIMAVSTTNRTAERRKQAFARIVKSRMLGLCLSKTEVAARAGLDRRTIYDILSARYQPTLDTIMRLESALEYDPGVLLVRVATMTRNRARPAPEKK